MNFQSGPEVIKITDTLYYSNAGQPFPWLINLPSTSFLVVLIHNAQKARSSHIGIDDILSMDEDTVLMQHITHSVII